LIADAFQPSEKWNEDQLPDHGGGEGATRLGLGTHLFINTLRPRNSEGTFSVFESSCHLLLPV